MPGNDELTLRGLPIRRRFARFGEVAGRSSGSAFGRGDALGAADDGDEETAVEQTFGHALGVRERYRIDQSGPALDIVDAEIVELHLHELARDPARGVEAERERALEVGLSLGEFRLGWSLLGEAADLALDDLDGLPGGVGARRGRAQQQRGLIEPDQAVGHAVGEAALLAHLEIKPRREGAAAE